MSSSKIHSPEAGYKGQTQNKLHMYDVQTTQQGIKQNYQLSVGKTLQSIEKNAAGIMHLLHYCLIDWIVFYAISAIFQPHNGGVRKPVEASIKKEILFIAFNRNNFCV